MFKNIFFKVVFFSVKEFDAIHDHLKIIRKKLTPAILNSKKTASIKIIQLLFIKKS